MALQILKTSDENITARCELRRRGIDCTSRRLAGLLRRYGILNGLNIGDVKKSWDVLKTVKLLEGVLTLADPVLDIGAYCSEILPILNRLGHTDLTGIDLNENIREMPSNETICYQVGDFCQGPFPDGSFAAVTAISVIEHGFDSNRLLSEVSRLLRPSGYFIASVDYWSEKIDTSGIKAFGLDWMIFSKADIENLFNEAARFGLLPVGEMDFATEQAPISWLGKSYTFAWFVLKKSEASL
jgi:SAM-dependent methyltransferase